jgi:glycosyltransferase involved in cell wall biosynthesis
MRRLARAGNRVMFVNSLSLGVPSVLKKDFWSKLGRKLQSYARYARRTQEGIIVVSPINFPFYSSRAGRAVNRFLLAAQIKLLMIAFDFRDPVLWVAIPTASDMAGRLGESALIYQVSDKYGAWLDDAGAKDAIAAMHESLLHRADLIYYSGRKLFEEETAARVELRDKSKMLYQAVDFDHFASATSREWEEPEDTALIPRPRLGYFGQVDGWFFDNELIRHVSRHRPHWQWVLLGLKTSRLEIEDLPNVHHLGSKPYSEMPRYAASFDVCVLPWRADDEFVSYGSAIKVREYMATGKPVVITPLYEYESLDGILGIARSYDDFIAKVEGALSGDSQERRRARQRAVESETWDSRAEEVSADITRLIEPNK